MKQIAVVALLAAALWAGAVARTAETRGADHGLNQLIRQLHSDSAAERARAAVMLGDLGAGAAPAVSALIGLLGDETGVSIYPDSVTTPADMASLALAWIGSPATEPLVQAFHSADPKVRRHAGEALAWSDDPRGAAELKLALDNKDPSATSLVASLIGELHAGSAVERVRAAMTLRGFGAGAAPAVPALVGLLGDEAAVWSHEIYNDLSMNSNYILPPAEVASEALARIGSPATEPLLKAFDSANPKIRRYAGEALAYTDDPQGFAELKLALGNRDPSVRSLAARMIGRHPDVRLEPLVAALHDPDPGVRLAAAESLQECESEAPDALADGLSDNNPLVRAATVEAVGSLAGPDSRAQAEVELLPMLHDKSPDVRRKTADALGMLRSGWNPVAPLIRRLSDEDKGVRDSAATALAWITGRDYGSNQRAWQGWWNRLNSRSKTR